jgi:hypothetical protein
VPNQSWIIPECGERIGAEFFELLPCLRRRKIEMNERFQLTSIAESGLITQLGTLFRSRSNPLERKVTVTLIEDHTPPKQMVARNTSNWNPDCCSDS